VLEQKELLVGSPPFTVQKHGRSLGFSCAFCFTGCHFLFCRPLSIGACALLLVTTSIACTSSLAQLPAAHHERASFGSLPLAAPLIADAPDTSLITAPDAGLLHSNRNVQRSKNTERVEQALQLEEMLSIDAVSAPIESLLFAVATDAGFELHINGDLSKQVTFKAIQQPIRVVLDTLAEQASFSWVMEGGRITVWSGAAYGFSYPINYLNIDRRTQSSVGLATQVGTINAADSGASVANSSETRVENLSEHHFWQSLNTDVEGLITQNYQALHSELQPTVSQFSINREAGLLTLYSTPDVHQSLQRYLALLHDSAQRQVLIEATVVEVALSDSFEAGVDWQVLAQGINGFSAAQVLVGAPLVNGNTVDRLVAPSGLISLVQQGSNGDVRATLSLLEQFGDVRILSRPRIIALNNQSSVLKVVDNRVYFTVNVERRQTDTKDEVVTETEIHTVPVGLVMNVTPQISRGGAVMLNVRPTLSRILGFVNDPNPELAQANVRNSVPEIQVREMESMLQVHSGNVAIIGGLMQDTTEGNDARLPGLGSLPVIKYLFSKRAHNRRQTELLIVLRPTVLPQPMMAASR